MGFLWNQNLTLGISYPDVTPRESMPHQSLAVNNTFIVLGVLTFAIQLCLVLLFMLRCWRLDNRIQEALKEPDSHKLIAPAYFHQDTYKQNHHQLYGEASASSTVVFEQYNPISSSLFTLSVPWDLVQHWHTDAVCQQ